METCRVYITGMACGGCASTVEKALRALDGVSEVHVSHTEGLAEVHFDSTKANGDQMKAAIEAAGYAVP